MRGEPSIHSDDLLPSLAELVGAWTTDIADTADETDGALVVESIALDLPVELQLLASADVGAGGMSLNASPPTQKLDTTVLPVWHRLRVRYMLDGEG